MTSPLSPAAAGDTVGDPDTVRLEGGIVWPLVAAAVATFVATALGLWDLGRKSLWYDEAFTVGIVDRPWGDVLWRITHWEVNQSPYYLLFSGWFRIGQGEGFMRLLSVAFAVAAVPAIFVLGRRLVDARVGAVASVLLAVHPLVVQWGQQMRSYSMVVFMVILATILLLRAVEEPQDTTRSLLYGAVAAATIYTQFFALLVVAAHLVWAALVRPIPRRVVTAACGAIGVLVLPLAWYLLTYEGDPLAWVQAGTDDALSTTVRGLTGGRLRHVAAYGVGVAMGLWALWPSKPDGTAQDASGADPGHDGFLASIRAERSWLPVLPLAWLVVPLTVTAAISYTVKPLLEARFLIVVVPALVLLVANGLVRMPWRPLAVVVFATLVGLSLTGVRTWHDAPAYEDWRTAVPAAVAAAGPEGALVLDPPLSLFALRYYEPEGTRSHRAHPHLGTPPVAPRLVELRRGFAEKTEGLHELYMGWRDKYYTRVDIQYFTGLSVTTYEIKP